MLQKLLLLLVANIQLDLFTGYIRAALHACCSTARLLIPCFNLTLAVLALLLVGDACAAEEAPDLGHHCLQQQVAYWSHIWADFGPVCTCHALHKLSLSLP